MSVQIPESLTTLFTEYQQIVATAPVEPQRVNYVPGIWPDKEAATLKQTPVTLTETEHADLLQASHSFEISGTEAALQAAHFTGTAKSLFDKYVALSDDPEAEAAASLQKLLRILAVVPEPQQRGATVYADGYYWAGRFAKVKI